MSLSRIFGSFHSDLSSFDKNQRTKHQQELNQLKQQFLALVQDHREQEQQLRKEKWKHETTVEGLLNRYDNEMGTKQVSQVESRQAFWSMAKSSCLKDELDNLTALYEEEKKQLSELEEKFKPLEEEYLKVRVYV